MFDTSKISQSLMIKSQMLAWLIENNLSRDSVHYKWSRVAFKVFGLTEFRSRTPHINIPWHPETIFPIPDLESKFDKTLDQILDQRALEIFVQARIRDKQIVIMWSGGIDSTAMLAAFIKNLALCDLERLTVCASTKSVSENPYFYETQIRGRLRIMHLRELKITNDFFKKNILLHGDPADCIFGPSTVSYQHLWAQNLYRQNWKDSAAMLHAIYHDKMDPTFSGWYVNMVNQQLMTLQQQGWFNRVQSISDWHWWQYFNFKWQGSLTRPLLYLKADPKESIQLDLLQEFFELSFYSHADFQIWSYQNLANLLGSGIHDHKILAKNYIFELDKNERYFNIKKKEGSSFLTWKTPLMIDQHAVHYHLDDQDLVYSFVDLLAESA